jgi:hypothetical protein
MKNVEKETMVSKKKFHFTIDVDYIPGSEGGLIELIEFCSQMELRPTIFITGMFAVEYAEVIVEAAKRGYELGTHGWSHGRSPEENFQTAPYQKQKQWIQMATDSIEKACGVRPVSFRAPNLWISEVTLEILESEGYLYDSSVPSRRLTLGYGQKNNFRYFLAPLSPYNPSIKNIGKKGNSAILEIPPSSFFLPINMSALRVFGLTIMKWIVYKVLNRSSTLVFYLHPAEFVVPDKLQLPDHEPKRHRVGIGPQNFDILSKFTETIIEIGYLSSYFSEYNL